MAHGSKKWITTFDGTIKRSTDRTKKDYWKGLKKWDADTRYHRWGRNLNTDKAMCPQCRHVEKPILEERKVAKEERARLHAEYERLYGDLNRKWEEYRKNKQWVSYLLPNGNVNWKEVNYAKRPKGNEPPRMYDWVDARVTARYWCYDSRSMLCFKHEHWYDLKWEMWRHPYLGCNANYQWMRKNDYREYRSEVKNLMRQERYDDICPKKKCWLD